MILYHGSNVHIDNIDYTKCKPYKDFGRGFYCTSIEKQAEFMAQRVVKRTGGTPCVTKIELNEEVFDDNSLDIKIFEKPTKEWANFILNNRNRNFKNIEDSICNLDNKYDLVVGPVANDDIIVLFRSFVNGYIDIDLLIKELTFKELTDQYSFHTEKVLKYLKVR